MTDKSADKDIDPALIKLKSELQMARYYLSLAETRVHRNDDWISEELANVRRIEALIMSQQRSNN
jgi:hypothetical protein